MKKNLRKNPFHVYPRKNLFTIGSSVQTGVGPKSVKATPSGSYMIIFIR